MVRKQRARLLFVFLAFLFKKTVKKRVEEKKANENT